MRFNFDANKVDEATDYLKARSKMKELGAVEINLTYNYRSVPEMIEGYNLIFTDQDGEKSFFPIFAKIFGKKLHLIGTSTGKQKIRQSENEK
jgi:ATP-dependent exoDNAse (exonuclease V) beta subunit